MKEDFLHYLWKYKKFDISNLKTTKNESIILQKIGIHNIENSGPDFFDTRLIIGEQKWVGNVEIHIKSSDWYAHNHEIDSNYDNVILHVVWEDDMDVFRKNNTIIPTLQLKDYVSPGLINNYQNLFQESKKSQISCEKQLPDVSGFILENWQERLYLERLEQKSTLIAELLQKTANDWEATLFLLLAKNFGLKVNGDAFLSIADSINFSVVRKNSDSIYKLEALFFGQSGLLQNDSSSEYSIMLKREYQFLKTKFKLDTSGCLPVQFFRLRPPNFPTIRLAQLAMLYFKNTQLFADSIQINSLEKLYKLFTVETSEFWQEHYTFDKVSTKRKKKITKSFIDLILINTIIPLRFLYAKTLGKNIEEEIFELINQLPSEHNHITKYFLSSNINIKNAMHSQAMIQLKKEYCDQKACLQCAIGNFLLNREQVLQ